MKEAWACKRGDEQLGEEILGEEVMGEGKTSRDSPPGYIARVGSYGLGLQWR